MSQRIAITRSSGNVFTDLKVPNPEAAVVRARLLMKLQETLAGDDLLTTRAAKAGAISKVQLEDVLRGAGEPSIDSVVEMLAAADCIIEAIEFSPKRERGCAR